MYIYYVYQYLREDLTPYYIGKGCGTRAWNAAAHRVSPPRNKSRITIIEDNLSEESAHRLEIELIAYYGRKDNGTGILRNMSDGGEGCGGRIVSIETRAKIGAKHHGKIVTPKSRAKMSASQKARAPCTVETRAKLSAAGAGRIVSIETISKLTGQKRSSETRAKMSAWQKGKTSWHKGRKKSEETKQRMRDGAKSRPPVTEEAKQNMSIAHLGKKHSQETIAKRNASNTGKIRSDESKQKMKDAWQIRKQKNVILNK